MTRHRFTTIIILYSWFVVGCTILIGLVMAIPIAMIVIGKLSTLNLSKDCPGMVHVTLMSSQVILLFEMA